MAITNRGQWDSHLPISGTGGIYRKDMTLKKFGKPHFWMMHGFWVFIYDANCPNYRIEGAYMWVKKNKPLDLRYNPARHG